VRLIRDRRASITGSAAALIAAGALLAVPAAVAKDFRPGDLRVCGRTQCAPIVNRSLLRVLSSYYWGPGRPLRAAPVRNGAPAFELRFTNGYASGIVATSRLDRFRAYGFFCGRFQRGKWYRFPARASVALRQLTAGFRPLRVSAPPPSC
jgi:hypothetical protein